MDWTEISRQVDLDYTCSHDVTELRQRYDSLQRLHVVKQCLQGGANLGAQSRSTVSVVEALPVYDEARQAAYYGAIRAEKERRFAEGQQERQADYADYLQSPHWKALRARVLRRDDGICQGCLVNRATEVHHLTYERRGREMAFDLVSLCRTCHEALSVREEAV